MNMSRFLGAMMAAAALALGACASKNEDSSRRSAGEFTSDAALTAKVKSAIASDAGLGSASAINVNSYRGVVQLSGFVDSKEKVDRAAEAARKVDGVTRVENGIQVKPAS
jgi:hyperosmotically inducible periplasmic protein